MNTEEKAKAYDEALKWMRELYPGLHGATKEDAEHYFPELKESEDEEIRKGLVNFILYKAGHLLDEETEHKFIAYLEKQKEASKAIEAVGRIDKYIDEHLANAHDMKDSNPDKKYYRGWDDALGKMAGILQDVYSGEKQKEQKPAEFTHHETDESLKDAVTHQMEDDGDIDDFVRKGIDDVVLKYAKLGAKWQKEQKPKEPDWCHHKVDLSGCSEEYMKAYYDGWNNCNQQHSQCKAEQKPAEWSEEDADILNCCISSIEEAKENRYAYKETDGDTSYDREIDWLKSLRPQPHWKPSEEQIYSLGTVVKGSGDCAVGSVGYNLKELYEQLKKLM